MKGVTTGLRAWLLQRATAVYLLLFVIFMPVVTWQVGIDNHASWRAFLAQPLVMVSWLLFFASLFAHAWVGIRDVVLDYVHALSLRFVMLALVAVLLLGQMLWVIVILIINAGGVS